MTTNRTQILAACGVLTAGMALALPADDRATKPAATDAAVSPAADDHDGWMKLKLISSQQAFEGLTHGEFSKVETAARRMLVLNLLEQWAKREEFTRRSQYRAQLNAFEYSVKELVRTAGDHDSDGALEAYVSMSRSCVRCHELIRDADGTSADK